MDSNITLQTKQMIDSLKAVCTNFGLGNASSEYKIITEVFLYKFLNDKFLFEAKRVEPALAKLSPADAEKQLAQMTDDDYELFLLGFDPDTAKLKQTHFISYLFNRKNEENFHMVFDDTLLDIATYNIDIFSVRTGGQSKMRLFSGISQHIISGHLSRSVAAIPSTYGQMSVYLPTIIVCSKKRFRSSTLSMVSRLAKKLSGQICGKSQKENTVLIF